jgi:hypothetical protein
MMQKTKGIEFLDTFLLRDLAEREGLATTLPMGYWDKSSALSPSRLR